MTEYELHDSIYTLQTLFNADINTYLSLMSGYLVAAYLVGKKLNMYQLLVLSVGFVLIEGLIIIAQTERFLDIVRLQKLLIQVTPDYTRTMPDFSAFVFLAIAVGGVLASLGFMWNARNRSAN